MVMDTVGTVLTCVSNGYALLKKIQDDQDRIREVPEMRKGILDRIEMIKPTLDLVRDKQCLQTPYVGESLEHVTDAMNNLHGLFNKIGDDLATNRTRVLRHIMSSDIFSGKNEKKLAKLLEVLKAAMDNLHIQITLVPVAILGNDMEGFFFSRKALEEINQAVKEHIGRDLAVMTMVKERTPHINGMVQITEKDQKAIEDQTGQKLAEIVEALKNPEMDESDSLYISGNTGNGKSRVCSGNLGVGSGYKRSPRGRTTVTNNHWEGSSRILTGDIGGENAVAICKAFWDGD